MFSKPFRVKSNTMMRNSDKRKLRSRLEGTYGPSFSAACDELIPSKSEVTAVAVVLHRGDVTDVYCVDGNPMFFECQPEQVILPSVYALWMCPGLVDAWFTGSAVVSKLQGGADLMMPGVFYDSRSADGGLGEFRRYTPRSVATPDNLASVGVGVTAVSSAAVKEQLTSGFELRGKGLLIKHTVRDHLWLYGSKAKRPEIAFPVHSAAASDQVTAEEESGECEGVAAAASAVSDSASASGAARSTMEEGICGSEQQPVDDLQESLAAASMEDGSAEQDERSPVERMDEMLEKCFLLALAYRLKKSELPVLTSNFYRTHMQSCCGQDESLDIKHSSYKKLSRFLAAMTSRFGCFTVKETSKGVDSVVDVNWSHMAIRQAKAQHGGELPPLAESSAPGSAGDPSTPEFNLFLSPSVDLLPVFSPCGHGKDALLTDSDVRQVVTRYVRENDLVSETDRSVIRLNDILSRGLRTKGELAPTLLRWDALMTAVKAKMLSRHQIVSAAGISVLHKGNLQHIVISTALRTGNKTVTLVDHVEVYGIEAKDLAERMQRVMASSASVLTNKGAKGKTERQVLIQGNAVTAVGNMLRDHYRVPPQAITVQQGKTKKAGGGGGKGKR